LPAVSQASCALFLFAYLIDDYWMIKVTERVSLQQLPNCKIPTTDLDTVLDTLVNMELLDGHGILVPWLQFGEHITHYRQIFENVRERIIAQSRLL
jgi:hypothetical protein